jgi:hypothetical protein
MMTVLLELSITYLVCPALLLLVLDKGMRPVIFALGVIVFLAVYRLGAALPVSQLFVNTK